MCARSTDIGTSRLCLLTVHFNAHVEISQFAVDQRNFVYFAFYFALSKCAFLRLTSPPVRLDADILTARFPVYVNALLAQLNARGAHLDGCDCDRLHGSTLVFITVPAVSIGPSTPQQLRDVEQGESSIQVRLCRLFFHRTADLSVCSLHVRRSSRSTKYI